MEKIKVIIDLVFGFTGKYISEKEAREISQLLEPPSDEEGLWALNILTEPKRDRI